ncbi:MAG: hypothetical protein MJ213_05825 [Bacilli bacterium]|nr:hypothetical protein [Bacilli bacterium]
MDLVLFADILEAIMVVAFGCSWPFNVYKSFKSKSTKGKSIVFLILIEVGYVAGITGKIINPNFDWSTRWWIFMFYILNFLMVLADIVLYFINRQREVKLKAVK